ncbi:MAG: dephospho-CoA kinase [Phycisphaerales bacterium]
MSSEPVTHEQFRALAPVVGLTGGVGAGKSKVAAILESFGCVVTRSDDDVRVEFDEPEVRRALVSWWGDRVLGPDGAIDRQAVADIVFHDDAERRRLEALIHPRVDRRRLEHWDREVRTGGVPPCFVIDAPLLFEAGLADRCDAVIFVDADRSERIRRVAAARGWSEEELDRREKRQWSLDRKRARSDYVVDNRGDLELLQPTVEAVFRQILRDHRRGMASSETDS